MMTYLVIKCGGSVLDNIHPSLYENIVKIQNQGIQPVVVHGGGPIISNLLNKLNIKTKFVDGLRVTDEKVLNIAEMVLSGSMNKAIVRNLQIAGGKAIGVSGIDGKLLVASPLQSNHKLGYVGKVDEVNVEFLQCLIDSKLIPVISPIAIDGKGQRWNINADMVAAAVAKKFNAKLCLITNVSGVIQDDRLLNDLTPTQIQRLIECGIITGGMVPKVTAAIECLEEGIDEVVILNGLEENAILSYVKGLPIGTTISNKDFISSR